MTNYNWTYSFIQMNSRKLIAMRKIAFVWAFLLMGALTGFAQTNPITTNPTDEVGCTQGGFVATFSINTVTGASAYIWEADTGSGFTSVPNASPFGGVNGPTMTIANPKGCKGSFTQDSTKFRCRVLVPSGPNSGNWVSASAMLILHAPVNTSDLMTKYGTYAKNVPNDTVCEGGTTWFKMLNLATFDTCVGIKEVTYQWQQKAPSGSWTNISSTTSQTDSLVLTNVSLSTDLYQYRCRLTMQGCTNLFYSDTVTLVVDPTPNANFDDSDNTINVCEGTAFNVLINIVNAELSSARSNAGIDWELYLDTSLMGGYASGFSNAPLDSLSGTGNGQISFSHGGISTTGVYRLRLTSVKNASSSLGCDRSLSEVLTINVYPRPMATLSSPSPRDICEGDSACFKLIVSNAEFNGAPLDWKLYVKDPKFIMDSTGVQYFGTGNQTITFCSGLGLLTDSFRITIDSIKLASGPAEILADSCPGGIGAQDTLDIRIVPSPNAVLGATSGQLTTLFSSNNGQAGNMFNITTTSAINIDSLALNIGAGYNNLPVKVYTRVGGYSGFENSPGAWTLVATTTVDGAGVNNPTIANVSFSLSGSTTYGIYIDWTNIFAGNYTNGSGTYTDGNITVSSGVGKAPNFGTTFSPRIWNGTVFYTGSGGIVSGDTVRVCQGEKIPFGFRVFNTVYEGINSNWQLTLTDPSGSVIYSSPVTGTGNGSFSDEILTDTLTPGTYTYSLNSIKLTATSGIPSIGCERIIPNQSFVFQVVPKIHAQFSKDTFNVCRGSGNTFDIEISNALFDGNPVNWEIFVTDTAGILPTTADTGTGNQTPSYMVPNNLPVGTYAIWLDSVYSRNTNPECKGILGVNDTIVINVFPNPTATLTSTDAVNDTIRICEGTNTNMTLTVDSAVWKGTPLNWRVDMSDATGTFVSPVTGNGNTIDLRSVSDTLQDGRYIINLSTVKLQPTPGISVVPECQRTVTDQILVLEIYSNPMADFAQDTVSVCQGDTADWDYQVTDALFLGTPFDWKLKFTDTSGLIIPSVVTGTGNVTPTVGVSRSLPVGQYMISIDSIGKINTDPLGCGNGYIEKEMIINVYPRPMASITQDTVVVCEGIAGNFDLSVTNTHFHGTDSVNWSLNFSDNTGSTLGASPFTGYGDTAVTFSTGTSLSPGYHILTLNSIVNTTHGCTRTLTDTLVVKVNRLPKLSITDVMDPICSGDSLYVAYQVDSAQAGEGFSFTYTVVPENSSVLPGTVTGTFGAGGTYSGIFTVADTFMRPPNSRILDFGPVTNTTTGCVEIDSVPDSTFYVHPIPSVDISGNPTVCSGMYDPMTGTPNTNWARTADFSYIVSGTTVGSLDKDWTMYYHVTNAGTGATSTTHSVTGSGDNGGAALTLNVPDSLFYYYNANGEAGTYHVVVDSIIITNGLALCYNNGPIDSSAFTVNPNPYITWDIKDSICLGNRLEFDADVRGVRGTGTNNNWRYTYNWDQTLYDATPYVGPKNVDGSDTGVFHEQSNYPIATGMWYVWSDTLVNKSTGCFYKPEKVDSFRVDPPTVAGSVLGSTTVCEDDNSGYLTLSGYTGHILYWQASYDEGFTWDTAKLAGNSPENKPISFSSLKDTLFYNNKTFKTRYRAIVKSGACDTAISTVGHVYVNPRPDAGIVSLDEFICTGDSAELKVNVVNVPTSNNWKIYYTQTTSNATGTLQDSGSGIFTFNIYNLSGVPSTVAIDSIYNTTTGCSQILTGADVIDSVYVYSFTDPGTLTADDIVCRGDNMGTLTVTGAKGGIQKWQYSTDGSATWTDINRTDTFYDYINVAVTTDFRVVVKNGTCPQEISDTVTVTVNALPHASITGSDTICPGNSANYTVRVDSTYGGSWAIQYLNGSVTDTLYGTGDGNFALNSGVIYSTTSVTLQKIWITSPLGSNPACQNTQIDNPGTATLTIIPYATATFISSNDTLCNGSNATIQVSVNNVNLGDNVKLSYSINGVNQTPVTFTGPGSHSFTINSSSLVATSAPNTKYGIRLDTATNLSSSTPCPGLINDSITITIDSATAAGSIAANDTVCYGGSGTVVQVSGGNGNIVKWQSRVQGNMAWTDINQATTSLAFSSLTDTTEYRAVYKNGVCPTAASGFVTAVPKPLPIATIVTQAATDTICAGNVATLSVTVTNVEAGDSVVITYVEGSVNKTTGYRVSSNPETFNLNTGALTTTTDVVLQTIQNIDPQGGQPACSNTLSAAKATVTVISVPFATIVTAPDTICQADVIPFTYNVSNVAATDNWELIYELEGDLDTLTGTGPGTFNHVDADANTAESARISLKEIRNVSNIGTCNSVNTDDWDIYIYKPTLAGTIEAPDTLCAGENTTVNEVSGTTKEGNIVDWEYRKASASNWTSLGNSSTSITATALMETTYYHAVYKSGVCDTMHSNTIEIIVRDLPVATITGSATVCAYDSTNLTITVTNVGSGQNWEIDLLNGTNSETISGTGSGNFTYTAGGYTSNTDVTLQVIRTITGTPQCVNNNLTNNATATVNVNQLPAATLISLTDSVCTGSFASGKANVANVKTAEAWRLYWSINGGSLDSTTGVGAGSFNFVTASLTANPSIVRLTRIVNLTTGCESAATDLDTVIVSPTTVGGTLVGVDTVCTDLNSGTIALTGNVGDILHWEYSQDNGATWTTINSTSGSYTYNNLTTTTLYRVLVRSGVCSAAYSSQLQIVVRPLPLAEISRVDQNNVCEGTGTYIVVAISNVLSSQDWKLTYLQGSVTSTLTGTGSTTDTIWTGPLANNTDVTLQKLEITSGAPMCNNYNLVNRHTTTIRVIEDALATITQWPDTVCKGSTPDFTVLVSQVNIGQSWSVNYSVVSNSGTTNRSESGAGPGQFAFSAGQLNTEGAVIVRLNSITTTLAGTSCTNDQLNDSVTIFVDSTSLGGTISGPGTVCYNTDGTLSLSGYRGKITKWQRSTDGINYFDVANTSDSLKFFNLVTQTWYRAVVQNGVCDPAVSQAFVVKIQSLPTVTIGNPSQKICSGETATLNLTIGNISSTDSWTITYKENGTTKTYSGSGLTESLKIGPLTATTDIEITDIVVTTGYMCSNSGLNEQATIIVIDNPNASIVNVPDSLCEGDILTFMVTVDNVQTGVAWDLDYDVDGSAGATVRGTGSRTVTINTNRAVKPSLALIELTQIELQSAPFCATALNVDTTVVVSPTTKGGVITADNETICEGDDVNLTLKGSVGQVQRWEYSVDGGATWTVLSNNDTFLNPGALTQTTRFRSFVKSGPCSGVYSNNAIVITVIPTPYAEVIAGSNVCPGEVATFTLNVTAVPAGHNWSVRYLVDGTLSNKAVTGTGSGNFDFTVPGKAYAGNPTFITVELVSIENTTQGCINEDLTSSAQVRVTPEPIAAFAALNSCEDTVAVFNNLSSIVEGSITGYKWYFGDGDSSSNPDPTHKYDNAGTYSVRLVATSDNGCIGEVTQNITIYDTPTADFAFENACLNRDLVLTDKSTIDNGNIASWFWDFGDGTTSTTQSPTHRYAAAGNYQVTLTIVSDNGCSSTESKEVVIYVLPDPSFVANPVCEDDVMNFENTSSIAYGTMRYEWEFAGQGTSFLENPSFTFTGFGQFNVTLVAESNFGCRDTFIKAVTVHPKPEPSFTVDPVCIGESSEFVNTSTVATGTIEEYYWNFGDTTFSGLEEPSHTYQRSGMFDVTLRVVTDKGCTDSVSGQAEVVPLPDVQLTTAGDRDFCEGDSVRLNANPNARTWRWTDPEGIETTGTDNIQAKKDGWYKVTITAPPIGCENTDSVRIIVWPLPFVNAWPADKFDQNIDTISKGASIDLHATPSDLYVYSWDPITYLDNNNAADVNAVKVLEDITYTVTVTDTSGCMNSADVTVIILNNFDLTVYNVVTPNGDGYNDTWFIENIWAYPDAEVVIVNRYGMEVFRGTGYQNTWDGTAEDGKELPDGAYYYIVTHPDFEEPVYTGAINLIRNRN